MKEISKKHKVSFGGEAIKRTFTVRKYDPNIANAVIKETNALFDIIHNSPIYAVIYSDDNGGSYTEYEMYSVAIKGNYYYRYTLTLRQNNTALSSMSELSIDKFVYPKDVIELAIKKAPSNIDIVFSKKKIYTARSDAGAGKSDSGLYDTIEKYVNSKYSDTLTTKRTAFNNLVFKKVK